MSSLCFVCELPIFSHQSWSTWKQSSNNHLTITSEVNRNNDNYVNNIYHQDCIQCAVCGNRFKENFSAAKRFGNKIYCPLHFADIGGSGAVGEEFMSKLKDFKRQSLGCAEARRKSSTTLTFPIPVQACPGREYCSNFPHGIKQTAGYWIECKGGSEEVTYLNEKDKGNTHDTLQTLPPLPSQLQRSTTSSKCLVIHGRLEKTETSKSVNDVSPFSRMQPPIINVIENQASQTKDDIELYRKLPNIVITGARTSPPASILTSHVHNDDKQDKSQTKEHQNPTLSISPPSSSSSQPSLSKPPMTSSSPPPPPPPPPPSSSSSSPPPPPESSLPSLLPEPHFRSPTSSHRPSTYPKPYDLFELISFQEEIYEKHFYGKEHWNYFTNDESLGPVVLSLKQETFGGRDQFRVLLRTISYSLHGLVPSSNLCADRYDREAVIRALGDEAGLKPSLCLGQLASTPEELLKLDQVFVKSELKVGIIFIKEGQTTEETILGNKEETPLFSEFLTILGDRIRLKGFDRYKGGLDTVHDLTGIESIYTNWKSIEIMFHVSTMLPHEENDPQKLQKKRHIGNDIVCVVFLEADDTPFWPGCIKSHFLHTFIVVQTSPKKIEEGETRKYSISVVCRDEVSAFKPYIYHESVFEKGPHFREWLLTKIVNGERASYSAPKFARMQDRTRSQMLEDIVTNLANHLATGQMPKPYRRGSWRPIGHMRPSSPLLDSIRDLFEGYDQLAKDFHNSFNGNTKMICDVAFNVMGNPGNGCHETQIRRIYGVRAILAIRSRVFLEMLYGFSAPGTMTNISDLKDGSNAITSLGGNKKVQPSSPEKPKTQRKSSLTASTIHKISQIPKIIHPSDSKNKRKESSVSNTSNTSASKTLTYLTVPGTSGVGGSFRAAFSRLVSGSWAGWGSKNRSDSIKSWQSESIYRKVDTNEIIEAPGLSVCADAAKIDTNKLAQTEFTIIEFDGDTFQLLIEYLHSGTCQLTCDTIPGLICAAEHFDLPDLLQACFHRAKTHLRLSVIPSMLNQLENYYWRYNSASQLVNAILKFMDPRVNKFFSRTEFLTLSESMITNILTRPGINLTEIRKFEIMHQWALNKVINDGQSISESTESITNNQLSPNKFKELKATMNRLTRDLKFHKIPPQDLIKVVLPSKTITHERILATLLYQADAGIYCQPNYAQFGS